MDANFFKLNEEMLQIIKYLEGKEQDKKIHVIDVLKYGESEMDLSGIVQDKLAKCKIMAEEV